MAHLVPHGEATSSLFILNPQVIGSGLVTPSGVCAGQRLGAAPVICQELPLSSGPVAHRDGSTACSMCSSSIPLEPGGVAITVTAAGATPENSDAGPEHGHL